MGGGDGDSAHEVRPQRNRERRERFRPAAQDDTAEESEVESAAAAPPMPERDGNGGCEFLEHTADVQLHSWAAGLREVLEWQVLGMFSYMTDRSTVEPRETLRVSVRGAHDLPSLLFKLMDEFLFHFSAEFFTVREMRVTRLDLTAWEADAVAWGERWDRARHPCGTEVKAITFQCLRVLSPGEDTEEDPTRPPVDSSLYNAYVVIDI